MSIGQNGYLILQQHSVCKHSTSGWYYTCGYQRINIPYLQVFKRMRLLTKTVWNVHVHVCAKIWVGANTCIWGWMVHVYTCMKLCTCTLPNRMSCWAWWRNVRLSNGVITSSPPRGKSSSTLTVLIVPIDSLYTHKYKCINTKYIVIKAGTIGQYQIWSFVKKVRMYF